MSEHKQTCGECGREPGGRHRDECSRSRVSRKLRDAHLGERGQRYICPPVGMPMRVEGDKDSVVVNPGIPYVRATDKKGKPAKPWNAGGIPNAIRNSPVVREVLSGQRPVSDLLTGRL